MTFTEHQMDHIESFILSTDFFRVKWVMEEIMDKFSEEITQHPVSVQRVLVRDILEPMEEQGKVKKKVQGKYETTEYGRTFRNQNK